MSRCEYVPVPPLPPMCTVHNEPQPCPKAGKPAIPWPIHAFTLPDRAESIKMARNRTAGSRPVMLHEGSAADPGHLTQLGETQCWCAYVVIPSG